MADRGSQIVHVGFHRGFPLLEILEVEYRAASHTSQWIICNGHIQARVFVNDHIETAEQGTASDQTDSVVDQIGSQFGVQPVPMSS